MTQTDTSIRRLADTALEIAQHIRDRMGSGWGKYPVGALYVLEQILPLVDVETRGTNGYGERTKSIAELVAEIRERM